MEITKNQKINFWDTNGRRSDVINALTIYLSILDELDKEIPGEPWARYPISLKQFYFYERAIQASPDVFKKHDNYDKFIRDIEPYRSQFLSKDPEFYEKVFKERFWDSFDSNIEARARHYTSNLVKFGLVNEAREITQAGKEFLYNQTTRDPIERLLPLSDLNIILLRQIMKLKIFSYVDKDSSTGRFYSPFFYGVQLILSSQALDKKSFASSLLNSSPFDIYKEDCVPEIFNRSTKVNRENFDEHFHTSKSVKETIDLYYKFYSAIYDMYHNMTALNYRKVIDLLADENGYSIKTAFLEKNKLKYGTKNRIYDFDRFITENKDSCWLDKSMTFNRIFYTQYVESKSNRLTMEYSDTLLRLFSATGLFNFSNGRPGLCFEELMRIVFSHVPLDSMITGEVSRLEHQKYEQFSHSYFGAHTPITDILRLDAATVQKILSEIYDQYGTMDVQSKLHEIRNNEMSKHIMDKYPKEQVVYLLDCISGRKKDAEVLKYVYEGSTIPAIFEYLMGIAWYYLSEQKFSLLDSLRLEINGDYEPITHGPGGGGDIEIHYRDGKILLIEVTLMNRQAQKRSEWEPVLRHSINLKAENEGKETTTLFVADELDMNTINIWRAVAMVRLESTINKTETEKVYIMPFTLQEIISFLQNDVKGEDIIRSVRTSFEQVHYDFDYEWREKIIKNITA